MIVAIDYGKAWCGLATSEGEIATPYKAIKHDRLIEELKLLAPEKIVVGVSEGKSAELAQKFASKLKEMVGLPVYFTDETLTTKEAQGITSDKKYQHAVCAALILERYLGNK